MDKFISEILNQTENEQLIKIITNLKKLNPTSKQYQNILIRIYHNFEEATIFLENNYPILEKILTSIDKDNIERFGFYRILIHLLNNDFYSYLTFLTEKLDIDWNQTKFLGSGSSNYSFSLEDKVLKIGTKRLTFNFPTFYRLNSFIIQKEFFLNNKTIYLEVSPKGEKTTITKEDKENIKRDFEEANLILTDPNFEDNFMLFEEELKEYPFKDIDGIHEEIIIEESETFKTKKLKLIDLDYIYKKDSNEIIYAPKL